MDRSVIPLWSWVAPLTAAALVAWEKIELPPPASALFEIVAPIVLIFTVFAAVRHAETVSARLGETIGTVVLAVAVTAIEVSLIASIMLQASTGTSTIARDTVFAGVMTVLNGVVGVSLIVGSARHTEQTFHPQGAASALGVLGTLAITSMILPYYTVSEPGPKFSPVQLLLVSIASLTLYGTYLLVAAGRQRAYFVSPGVGTVAPRKVTRALAAVSAGLLLTALAAVVLLAEALTPALQRAVHWAGLDDEFVGVVIAALVLLPEGSSAVASARTNRLQSSLNFALGSAIASVGLTIPAISLLSFVYGIPIALGLEPEHVVLLATTLFISTLTLSTGKTTVLQGAVHLVIFLIFILIAAVP